jgi:hypothetical protein
MDAPAMTITRAEAAAIAERALPELFPGMTESVRIDHGSTREVGGHWVFFWNTVEYLETGAEEAMLAGNAPVVVRASDGEVFAADIRRSLEEQLGAPSG